MASVMLKQSRWTIVLSLNAAAILIAGILIASAIWFNGGTEFRVVGERTDIVAGNVSGPALEDAVTNSDINTTAEPLPEDNYTAPASHEFDDSEVRAGELWNEDSIVIYATPDTDICAGGGLTDLGNMYWQTSNPNVISGFYDTARTWLGYSEDTCRFPVINGTGVTTIIAGTYDGKRRDSIDVTVVEPPVDQWEREILTLVNRVRVKYGLERLTWSNTCDAAALLRAQEITDVYSHVRPDGSSWSTACPVPASGGTSGENLAIGNAAVSPATVVSLWMGSASHRANILNPDYTKMAAGFVFDLKSDYKTHWSQIFSTY